MKTIIAIQDYVHRFGDERKYWLPTGIVAVIAAWAFAAYLYFTL